MITGGINLEPTVQAQAEIQDRKLKKALQGFESMFVLQLLKSMRSAFIGEDKKNGFGGDTFMSMSEMSFADYLGKNESLGIAQILYKHFKNQQSEPSHISSLQTTDPKHIELDKSRDTTTLDEQNYQNSAQDSNAEEVSQNIPELEKLLEIVKSANVEKPQKVLSVNELTITQNASSESLKDTISAAVERAADQYNLSENLLHAVIQAESGGDSTAISSKGAKGLMQLIDSTALEMGVSDQFDPEQNVMGGAKYLRKLLDHFKGDLKLALAAYNAGPGNVQKFGGIPPFKETRNYVTKVVNLMNAGNSGKDSQLSADKAYKEEGWNTSIRKF